MLGLKWKNWSAPTAKVYEIAYKNLYGMTVVRMAYRLNYTHGGSFQGKGSYLSNVQVTPVNIRVLWGFKLDASVETRNIQNTASLESPVPAVEMLVKYHVKTLFVDDQGSEVLYVRGDGFNTQM